MAVQCGTGQHGTHDVYDAQCPCRWLLDLLANKWSALAIGALEHGPQRFGALRRHLQGVSPKVLTQTLRRLEDAGLVDRVIYPSVPLHTEYSLTARGHGAAVPLRSLRIWVEANVDDIPAAPSCATSSRAGHRGDGPFGPTAVSSPTRRTGTGRAG